MILSMYAQGKVSSAFNKYSKYSNSRGYTGREVAEMMLRRAGIYDVSVQHIRGKLSDHYDPRNKVLRLSDTVYDSTSIAAIGVAAHECGHAIQHSNNYVFLTIRHSIVPVVNIANSMSMPLIMLGVFFGGFNAQTSLGSMMIQVGIVLFSLVVLFQLITLPVEFDASRRAIKILEGDGYLNHEEIKPAKKVLSAAALTYVAAATVAILNLVRLLLIFGGRDD
jgi:Zn-dependent membrane protease YugP